MSVRGWLLAGVLVASWLIDLRSVAVWRSSETLWRHAATVTPHSVRATKNDLIHRFARGDM